MSEQLFEPTADERWHRLTRFIREEKQHRLRMVEKYPHKAEYWHNRVAQADEALRDLEALKGGAT